MEIEIKAETQDEYVLKQKKINKFVEKVEKIEAAILEVIKRESPECFCSKEVQKALQLVERRLFYS